MLRACQTRTLPLTRVCQGCVPRNVLVRQSGQQLRKSSPLLSTPQRTLGSRHTSRAIFPFDLAWAPDVNAASLAPQLFAASLFPYLVFLWFLTKSEKVPKLTVYGFYFLLVFVGATIPAGIYAKVHYGVSLANVDWLHGTAESLLTITNLLIVLGLRQGIRDAVAPASETAVKATDEAIPSSLPTDADSAARK